MAGLWAGLPPEETHGPRPGPGTTGIRGSLVNLHTSVTPRLSPTLRSLNPPQACTGRNGGWGQEGVPPPSHRRLPAGGRGPHPTGGLTARPRACAEEVCGIRGGQRLRHHLRCQSDGSAARPQGNTRKGFQRGEPLINKIRRTKFCSDAKKDPEVHVDE